MGRYGGQLKDVRADDLAAVVLKEVCERAGVKPAEVAEVAAFLLSGRSGLMTGWVIDFDQSVVGTHEK